MLRTVTTALAALVLAASLPARPAAPQDKARLEVTYEVSCSDEELPSCTEALKKTLESRARAYGLDGLQIRALDSSHLLVSVTDFPGAADLLTRPGKLSLRLVDDSPETWKALGAVPPGARLETWAGIKGTYHEISGDVEETVRRAFEGRLPGDREVGIAVNLEPGGSEGIFSGIVLHKKPVVPADSLASAKTLPSTDEAEMPAVLVELSAEGARAFEKTTSAHVGERLAVVVDGEVIHAPKIREAITGGKVQLTKCAWRVKLNAADLARAYAAVLAAPLPEGVKTGSPAP